MSVQTALTHFVAHYEKTYPELTEIFDPEWRSPCETGEPYRDSEGVVRVPWRPLPRSLQVPEMHDFEGLENALETEIHPDIKAYYGSFWSGGLEAEAPQGHVSLILLWNEEDASRLIENLIGHALAKRRARSPLSIFFACTEQDSDLFLSVDNATGNVLIEKPGHKPVDVVAESLASFIDSLVPASPDLHPERSLLR